MRGISVLREGVLLIGGSGGHGVPYHHQGPQGRLSPRDIVDRYRTIIKDSFEEFGISFDACGRTSSRRIPVDLRFLPPPLRRGEFCGEEVLHAAVYDEEAGQFLADRYVTGKCPHCGAEGAYGDQCGRAAQASTPPT